MRAKTLWIIAAICEVLVMGGHCYAAENGLQGVGKPAERQEIDWYFNPSEHRGKNGQRFTYVCPANGVAYLLYGSDVYTDDSSVCTAAVHAGLISLGRGGPVIVEIRPGQTAYQASARNGVGSLPFRSFAGSFVLEAAPEEIRWSSTATEHRGKNGQRFMCACPANGVARTIYGSDIYTDDSSICTAAVHAGLISLQGGGAVTIEIRPGEKSYAASTGNGVTSLTYGAWHGSFVFIR